MLQRVPQKTSSASRPGWFGVIAGLCLGLALLTPGALRADDATAQSKIEQALAELKDGDYAAAAEAFADAEIEAEDPALKVSALTRAAEAYRKAGYLGKEYEMIEMLLGKYPTQVDFAALVDREFAIGDEYFHGYRDPAFWSLRRWGLWTDKSKMVNVYESAVKHAPFAERAANARLRLAVHYLEDNQTEKALPLLREIITYYPGTEACRYALLELGNALYEQSQRGDGDGRKFEEAMSTLQRYLERYPEGSEAEWVKITMTKAQDVYAERLYNIGAYYQRSGHEQAAELYYLQVLRQFPESTAAGRSETRLTTIDRTYFPERIEFDVPERIPAYESFPIPQEDHKLIMVPSNSDNRFLLPIRDLNLPKREGR